MSRSVTSLRKWGVTDKELPTVEQIKHIHVYDFDNTLFKTALPSRQLWEGVSIGFLQQEDALVNGGWWHDATILAATGKGAEEEEKSAWEGFWNQHIVNLAQLSMEQKETLNVLLTGRSQERFADLIQRMVTAKGLHFHLICLRPKVGPMNQEFESTAKFKQALLEDLLLTYCHASEILVYEDRDKHVKMFRNFFANFNSTITANNGSNQRPQLNAEVIPVLDNAVDLDPITEVAEVQRMLNSHNQAVQTGNVPSNANHVRPRLFEIQRRVLFTGYLISPGDTERLLAASDVPRDLKPWEGGIISLANSIMIKPGPICPRNILDMVGGIGKKVKWRVTAFGNFEKKVWAAKVQPMPPSERVHCADPAPYVVLGYKKSSKPLDASRIRNWIPLPGGKQLDFETVVGEKVLLRIEERGKDTLLKENRPIKRPQTFDVEEFPALGSAGVNPSKAPNLSAVSHNRQQTRNYTSNIATGYARAAGAGGQQRGRGGPSFSSRGGVGGSGRGNAGGGGSFNPQPAGRGGFQRGGMNGSQGGRGRGRGGHGGTYRSLDDATGKNGKRDGVPTGDGGLLY